MNFNDAVTAVLAGEIVTRRDWFPYRRVIRTQKLDVNSKFPWIIVEDISGKRSWNPSQMDIFATDWEILKIEPKEQGISKLDARQFFNKYGNLNVKFHLYDSIERQFVFKASLNPDESRRLYVYCKQIIAVPKFFHDETISVRTLPVDKAVVKDGKVVVETFQRQNS